jgi:hypothetical protein
MRRHMLRITQNQSKSGQREPRRRGLFVEGLVIVPHTIDAQRAR